jgi:DNA-binding MarR family transcriptional regulator
VKREPSPTDKRASLLSLTAKGAAVHERSAPLIRRATAEMTQGFTSGEMDVVFRFLRAVVDKYADEEDEI